VTSLTEGTEFCKKVAGNYDGELCCFSQDRRTFCQTCITVSEGIECNKLRLEFNTVTHKYSEY